MLDKSILVFGCGNILWGDDGFGPAVARACGIIAGFIGATPKP